MKRNNHMLLLLGLVVFIYLIRPNMSKDSHIKFIANTKLVKIGTTKNFFLNCSYDEQTKVESIKSLELEKWVAKKDKKLETERLASIGKTPSVLVFGSKSKSTAKVKYAGKVPPKGTGYITAVWEKIVKGIGGIYMCSVHTMDNKARMKTFSKNITIEEV